MNLYAGGGLFIAGGVAKLEAALKMYGSSVYGNTARLQDENIYVISDAEEGCPIGYFSREGSGWCDRCPSGQYRVDPEEPDCTTCDESRENCTLGGAALFPNPFFWHSNGGPNSHNPGCKLDNIIR